MEPAHEIGHEILKAFGDVYYSYGYKGSVNVFFQTRKEGTPDIDLTKNNEIDIMPYYKSANKLSYDSYNRYVVSSEDLLGLLWLTKIKIQ